MKASAVIAATLCATWEHALAGRGITVCSFLGVGGRRRPPTLRACQPSRYWPGRPAVRRIAPLASQFLHAAGRQHPSARRGCGRLGTWACSCMPSGRLPAGLPASPGSTPGGSWPHGLFFSGLAVHGVDSEWSGVCAWFCVSWSVLPVSDWCRAVQSQHATLDDRL
jgi:hypothetical protein